MVWQQEHRLIYEDFLDRYRIVVFIFVGFFLLLSFRLFLLQVIKGTYYRELSEQQRTHIVPERAPRGTIYDCRGNVLAGSKTAFVAVFYPFTQGKTPTVEIISQLKTILNKDLGVAITKGWRSGQAVRLADNLTREEMFRLQEKRMILPGISVVNEARRDYPDAETNAHLIGYLSEITNKELETLGHEGYYNGELMGRGGLEQMYNGLLRGQDGGWQIEVDALGHQTRVVRRIPPIIGHNLYTTIDARLQVVAGEGLRNSPTGKGAAIALDVRTGAVRCFVSAPGFDPATATKEYGKYLQDKRLPLYNRVVQALYPPGSTFKIVTFTGALAEGGVDSSLSYYCNGHFELGNKRFACWDKKGHGRISLIGALAGSCNVYFYQLGLKIGERIVEKYAKAYQLGEKTGIDMPSEKKGLVPGPEWKQKKMHERWQQGDTVNVSIGQGPLWVTPLQMASLVAAVANGGTFYQPYIVDHITTARGDTVFRMQPHKRGEIALDPRVWELLHRGLEEVVTNGTGRGCYFPNLKVAGKTGTAQNPHGNDHAWFVSYAPADNPELAVAVIVENGGHGGTASVPIVRKMYETYFDLIKSTATATNVAGSTMTVTAAGGTNRTSTGTVTNATAGR